jgi:hypothetical protein
MTTIKTVTEASADGWLKLLVPDALRGRRLEVVAQVRPQAPAPTPEAQRARLERLRVVMERIARRGGLAGVADPAQWQREQRAERSLPGRPD